MVYQRKDESTLVTDYSVPFMHHDQNDLGSLVNLILACRTGGLDGQRAKRDARAQSARGRAPRSCITRTEKGRVHISALYITLRDT